MDVFTRLSHRECVKGGDARSPRREHHYNGHRHRPGQSWINMCHEISPSVGFPQTGVPGISLRCYAPLPEIVPRVFTNGHHNSCPGRKGSSDAHERGDLIRRVRLVHHHHDVCDVHHGEQATEDVHNRGGDGPVIDERVGHRACG